MHPQLSRVQFVFLSTWLILGTGILTMPFAIGQFAIRDSWIAPLLFAVTGGIVVGVIALFRRMFPGQSLVEGYHMAFGPIVGRAASLWFLYMTFLTESFVLREVSLFSNITVLPSTPNYVVTAVFMIPVAYAVYLGAEVVGRVGEIITPLGIAITLILFLLSMQHADPSHLRPVLADGWKPILQSGVVLWVYAWEFLFVLQLREEVQQQRLVKDLLITILIITSAGVVAELTITMILGPSVTYSIYPILEVVRTIRIGDFLERLDTFYVMGVITTIFVKLSLIHYIFTTGLSHWFGLRHYRPTVWSGAAVVWTGSLFLIHNSVSLMNFILYTAWGYFTFTAMVIPLLAVVVQWWRQRRGLHQQ
ncbi:GerAB/ArcD/ProY family transporter [Kyrpidia spormannii]|uniref:Spore gernimation protein n=1 Tax=Kyrpidia spormannii TaxID=2055160 RepID=A0A6F9E0U2_9BACL|nr:endospore germination permease [Kyrpidia spormannii]CAB3390120.1 Spore gernimation protein [Kyrpidia spormannii]